MAVILTKTLMYEYIPSHKVLLFQMYEVMTGLQSVRESPKEVYASVVPLLGEYNVAVYMNTHGAYSAAQTKHKQQ